MYVKGEGRYRFPIDHEKLRKSISVTDVYRDCGILDFFKAQGIKGDIAMLSVNRNTLDALHDRLRANLKTSRDKRVRAFAQKYRESRFAMDWLCYAPEVSDDVPDWEIALDLKGGRDAARANRGEDSGSEDDV